MDYHSPGNSVSRLSGSIPNPTDLSQRLMSTQQTQQETEYENDDESSDNPSRSHISSITQPGFPFRGTLSSSPAPRSPVLIQCCCGKDDCHNLAMFLRSISSLEDELRLAAGKFNNFTLNNTLKKKKRKQIKFGRCNFLFLTSTS